MPNSQHRGLIAFVFQFQLSMGNLTNAKGLLTIGIREKVEILTTMLASISPNHQQGQGEQATHHHLLHCADCATEAPGMVSSSSG
jgi:hypothetical protein